MGSNTEADIAVIKKALNTFLEDENYEINATQITTEGANYMGLLYLLDVIREGQDTLKLFAKVSNIPAEARQFIPVNHVYNNEVLMYTKIAEEFRKLEEKHDVPVENRFAFTKYYGSSLTEFEEVVILENLADKGYEMFDRFKSLDWEFARAALEQLAKFHALSFALKKESPETFEALSKTVTNYFFENTADPEQMWAIARAKCGDVNEENRARVVKYIEDVNDVFQHVKPSSKYSVIVHGDYRASNMLVKYEGGSIKALMPIDYQTASHGNPVSDLIYLLFTGSDEQFRKDHFEQFVEHYHDSLRDYLKLLSHDINDIYPKSAFYFELKDRLSYGLELAFILLPTILVKNEDKVEMGDLVSEDAIKESFGNMKTGQAYVDRLNGIVNDMVRWGVLPEPEAETTVENGTAAEEENGTAAEEENGTGADEECADKLEETVISDD